MFSNIQVMEDSELSKKEIDEIVLVGGSTRIPKIQQLVKDFFNGKVLHCSVLRKVFVKCWHECFLSWLIGAGENKNEKDRPNQNLSLIGVVLMNDIVKLVTFLVCLNNEILGLSALFSLAS